MRRDRGPKRNAEAYAYRIYVNQTDKHGNPQQTLQKLLAAAHLAGYRSAARKRRKTLIK